MQLAVTMDYSIFLWHSYNEQCALQDEKEKAMAVAIWETLTSVVGSSITTIAGFISLCFMSFTMGRDLGIVMAKGVFFGVVGCVTVLPALILILDKPLQAIRHRALIPNIGKVAGGIVKWFPLILVIFVLLVPPAWYGYNQTNDEVYYDMGECLPKDMEYVIANSKLADDFNIASTHMLLVDRSVSTKDIRSMISEMEQVDGVKYVLGLESVVGSRVPEEILPESIVSILKSDRWELMLINSEYKVASDDVDVQIDDLNAILKKYDKNGMLIGEAPCMKDLIETSKIDITPKVVDCIVFWTKNPEPMLNRLEELAPYDYYFQFTLTGYGKDIECNVPHKKEKMIPIFQELSKKIGMKKVIWRYDPIIFTKKYTPEYHLKAFEQIATALKGYTAKCVISFVDVYAKNKKNMELLDSYEIDKKALLEFAKKIAEIAKGNGMMIGSCAESVDLDECGIEHNCCVDKTLIEDIIGCRLKVEKDKNQRQECGCMESVEIGTYNTCKNGCKYCYANYSEESVVKNCCKYDPESPILCGELDENDKITDRKVKSLKEQQLSIFDL